MLDIEKPEKLRFSLGMLLLGDDEPWNRAVILYPRPVESYASRLRDFEGEGNGVYVANGARSDLEYSTTLRTLDRARYWLLISDFGS